MPGMPLDPITTGKDYNYFKRFSVTDTTFPSIPQVFIAFRGPQRLIFTIETGTVEYSFNGNTLHGDLVGGTERGKMEFITRPNKQIWFRASAAAEITVEAYHVG